VDNFFPSFRYKHGVLHKLQTRNDCLSTKSKLKTCVRLKAEKLGKPLGCAIARK